MDQLEGDARLDQRVIHAEHVIFGAIAGTDARMVCGGLFRVEQRDARQRLLVAEVALVLEVPLVDALDRLAASGGRRARRRTW